MAETHRVWMGVIWDESADPDFLSKFEEEGIRGFAILHDQDKYDTGEIKKPHWHVLSIFQGKKSYSQMMDLYKRCAGDGVNTVRFREDIGGAARYLCHLDSPHKHHYDPHEVISLNGADYLEAVTTQSDLTKFDIQIKLLIDQYDICYFNHLSDYATFVVPDWRKCVDGRAVYWVKYLAARVESQSDRRHTSSELIQMIDEFKKEILEDDH